MRNKTSPAHLLEHQRALPRPDGLRQFGDATLVEVRPREAAVVDKDLGAAVAAVGWRAVGVEGGRSQLCHRPIRSTHFDGGYTGYNKVLVKLS